MSVLSLEFFFYKFPQKMRLIDVFFFFMARFLTDATHSLENTVIKIILNNRVVIRGKTSFKSQNHLFHATHKKPSPN